MQNRDKVTENFKTKKRDWWTKNPLQLQIFVNLYTRDARVPIQHSRNQEVAS